MKLASLYLDPSRGTPSVTLASLRELGVSHAYCILITGRCGSTLLSKLIGSLDSFGLPDEYFSEEFVPHVSKRLATECWNDIFSDIICNGMRGSVFGFQIDPLRLRQIDSLLGISAALVSEENFPCLYMRREDILAQAYSYAVSKLTGHWHVFSDSGNEPLTADSFLGGLTCDQRRDFCKQVLQEALLIFGYETAIENILDQRPQKTPILSYEQLIADRNFSVYRSLLELGASPVVLEQTLARKADLEKSPTKKQSYAYRELIFRDLYEHCKDIVLSVNTERSSIVADVRQALELL